MNKKNTAQKMSTKTLTLIGMMIAITAMLACTPLGLIPLPLISASTVHIPTIIIAMLEGPLVGAIVGGAMGIITLLRALLAPVGVLEPYFINPIISVLPRILIGVGAAYTYRGVYKIVKKDGIAFIIGGAVGSIINTVVVLGLLYVIYAAPITEKIGSAAGPAFMGIAATSGSMEMVCSAIISSVTAIALRKVVYVKRMA